MTVRRESAIPNLVGVADGELTCGNAPLIHALAPLDPEPARQGDADLRAHVSCRDVPAGPANRPRPALSEPPAGEDRLSGWHDSRLGRPGPLADDPFVVPVHARTFRGGSRGQPFVFALVNDRSEMTGRLHGLHEWCDSPFTGFRFNMVTDVRRGRAFHLNRHGLYAWNRAGAPRAKPDTGSETFKALTHFTPGGCSPDGDLLLVHTTQHLVLRVPARHRRPDRAPDRGRGGTARVRTAAHRPGEAVGACRLALGAGVRAGPPPLTARPHHLPASGLVPDARCRTPGARHRCRRHCPHGCRHRAYCRS
ncbi:hypothetical protein [Streptomyces sp. H27-S2]|uniref:hypothetical protein n=1 Tax=Streptomyces antarcticus TaxID=2996458 RepID=UPI00226D4A92|nr:hypothetical protein [Streptomyces sp. H27-S2]MCY0954603.1 hypothetical protein [Streptomyces sp. H27-S2]